MEEGGKKRRYVCLYLCVCRGGAEDVLEIFCLALFFVVRVRAAYKSVLCVSEKYLALRWRGQENRCHLFNKVILIGKKNVGWIWRGEGGSMWSCLSIGRFYGTEEQIKFSWTSQIGLSEPAAPRPHCACRPVCPTQHHPAHIKSSAHFFQLTSCSPSQRFLYSASSLYTEPQRMTGWRTAKYYKPSLGFTSGM